MRGLSGHQQGVQLGATLEQSCGGGIAQGFQAARSQVQSVLGAQARRSKDAEFIQGADLEGGASPRETRLERNDASKHARMLSLELLFHRVC
jgi:hypothetical protein